MQDFISTLVGLGMLLVIAVLVIGANKLMQWLIGEDK